MVVHGPAQLSFDQGRHHESHHMQVQIGDHPLIFLEQNGREFLPGFKLRVPFFQEGLELVDFQDSLGGVVGRFQVGDEGEDAIGQRFLFEGLAVHLEGNRKVRFPAYLALLPALGRPRLGKCFWDW